METEIEAVSSHTTRPAAVSSDGFGLAEGPVWDARRGHLLWVDIVGRAVMVGQLADESLSVLQTHRFDGLVGAVAVADDGTLLVAEQEGLVVQHLDGTRQLGPQIVRVDEGRRLNDGGIDPAGRFVVGTLSINGDSTSEVLVRLEMDGSITTIDSDLTLSNGLAWSVDGTRMYSVDTLRRTVFVRDYDAVTGESGERGVHLELDDGYPDGLAMDEADHLWIAIWGLGRVCRYSPDGTLVEVVDVPAPHTSSVAFAGEDLRTLVITSATDQLSAQQLRDNPDSGRIFTVRVDVAGAHVPAWCGLVRP